MGVVLMMCWCRHRRSTRAEEAGDGHTEEDVVDAFVKDEEIRDLDVTINTLSDELESLEVCVCVCVFINALLYHHNYFQR